MNDYSIIRVYTGERVRYEGKSLPDAVVAAVRSLQIAARCVVLRGSGGCYESGETSTARIVDLSYDLPVIVEIILPRADEKAVLERLDAMVLDGVVAVVQASVSLHRTSASLVPRNLRVRDVMTVDPVCAHEDFPVRAAAELLLDGKFKALPVVDGDRRCVGIVTQDDLVSRAGMPVRLGLMPLIPARQREAWLRSCEGVRCGGIMTPSPSVVKDYVRLSDAIEIMNREGRKRLPVIDERGTVVGMLSRIDILRTIAMARSAATSVPEGAEGAAAARFVYELTGRDTLSLQEGTGLREAIDALVANGKQRAAVVDGEGRLVGIITDRILLGALGGLAGGKTGFGLLRRAKRAASPISGIMERNLRCATEKMTIYEALGIMTEYGLKRVPVVDSENVFRGMISRDLIMLAFSRLWEEPPSGA